MFQDCSLKSNESFKDMYALLKFVSSLLILLLLSKLAQSSSITTGKPVDNTNINLMIASCVLIWVVVYMINFEIVIKQACKYLLLARTKIYSKYVMRLFLLNDRYIWIYCVNCCRYKAELCRWQCGCPPRTFAVPPSSPVSTGSLCQNQTNASRRLPDYTVDQGTVFLCRQVYDVKLRRILKNPHVHVNQSMCVWNLSCDSVLRHISWSCGLLESALNFFDCRYQHIRQLFVD